MGKEKQQHYQVEVHAKTNKSDTVKIETKTNSIRERTIKQEERNTNELAHSKMQNPSTTKHNKMAVHQSN